MKPFNSQHNPNASYFHQSISNPIYFSGQHSVITFVELLLCDSVSSSSFAHLFILIYAKKNDKWEWLYYNYVTKKGKKKYFLHLTTRVSCETFRPLDKLMSAVLVDAFQIERRQATSYTVHHLKTMWFHCFLMRDSIVSVVTRSFLKCIAHQSNNKNHKKKYDMKSSQPFYLFLWFKLLPIKSNSMQWETVIS